MLIRFRADMMLVDSEQGHLRVRTIAWSTQRCCCKASSSST